MKNLIKILILGLIFINSNFLGAQEYYYVEVSASNFNKASGIGGCRSGCMSPQWDYTISVLCKDGSVVGLKDLTNTNLNNPRSGFWEGFLVCEPSKIIVDVGYVEDSIYQEEFFYCEDKQEIDLAGYVPNQVIMTGVGNCLEIDLGVIVRPLSALTTSVYPICFEDNITIEASNSMKARYYNWKYRKVGSSTWIDLPAFNGRSSIDVSLANFPGLTIRDNIQIVLNYKENIFSNSVLINYIACSPNWVSTDPTNTSCYTLNDGGVRLTFDTNVASGYEMRYYIYQGHPSSFTGDPESGTLPQAYTDYRIPLLTNNGNGTYSGSSANNLEPGAYYIVYQEVQYSGTNVTVKSGEITPQFVIEGPSQIVTSIASTEQPQCVGEPGVVRLSSVGGAEFGSGTLQYSIVGSGVWQSSNTFNNLAQGQGYRFVSRRSASCEGIQTGLVTIATVSNSLSINTATGVIEQPYNPTSTNGKIRVFTDNGVAPYTYMVLDANNSNQEVSRITNTMDSPRDITGLLPGRYIIQVEDANGCSVRSGVINLESLPVPQLGVPDITQVRCIDEQNGGITIPVTDGFEYRWFKDGVAYPGDTPVLNALGAGSYELEVIPNGGDFTIAATVVRSTPIVLNNPAAVEIRNPVVEDMDCYGDGDGKITIEVSGGSSYQYYIDDTTGWQPLFNGEISIAKGGFYDITVRNQNECLSNTLTNIFVYEPDALELYIDNKEEVSSFGGNDGAILVTIEGGTPPYTYEWHADNGFVSFSEDITMLEAGEYMLVVSDANSTTSGVSGCVLIQEFTITQPDIIIETITNPTCYQGCDGSISLLVNEGIGNFRYSWDNGDTGDTITGLCSGSYTVTVEGLPNGTQQRTYMVNNPAELVISLPEQKTFCKGQELQLDATIEGQGAIVYQWSSELGFSSANPIVTVPGAGVYTIKVTDPKNCEAIKSITVVQSEAEINAEFAVSSQVFTEEEVSLVDLSYPIPDSIDWILPAEASIKKQDQDEVVLTFSEAGEYEIGLRTKVGDCEEIQSKKVLVVDTEATRDNNEEVEAAQKIEDFILYPNPTTGKFSVEVTLQDLGAIDVKVFSLSSNRMMVREQRDKDKEYTIGFDLSGVSSGIYAVVLETPYGSALRKIVVK